MGKERRRKQCVSVILVSALLKHSGVLQKEKEEKEDSKRVS